MNYSGCVMATEDGGQGQKRIWILEQRIFRLTKQILGRSCGTHVRDIPGVFVSFLLNKKRDAAKKMIQVGKGDDDVSALISRRR